MARAHDTSSHKIKIWFTSKHFLGRNEIRIHFWMEMCVISAQFDISKKLLPKQLALQGFTLSGYAVGLMFPTYSVNHRRTIAFTNIHFHLFTNI